MKSKILTIIGLSIYCLIIFLPQIIHGYVYPSIGDDTAVYLTSFEKIQEQGLSVTVQYSGYIIIGYLVILLSNIFATSLEVVFLWFSFTALSMIGITIYLVMSRLTNSLVGWLALLLTIFTAQGILFQFYYGQIFNAINIGLILPLLILILANYLEKGKKIDLFLLIIFIVLFSTFHTSGIYLPAMVGFALLIYVIYGKIKKKPLQKRALYLGSGILFVSLLAFICVVFIPSIIALREYSSEPLKMSISNVGKSVAVPFYDWAMSIVSPSILILLALAVAYSKDIRKLLSQYKVKVMVYLLIVLIILLILVTFTKLSLDPWRQSLDLATILAILVSFCTGVLLSYQKNIVLYLVVIIAVGFGLFHNLPTWFSYNSAICEADLEVLAYADNYDTFSCSSTVAPWIYERYTTATWMPNDADIVIMRNKPMSPRSDPDNMWFQNHGWIPSNEYELVKMVDDGEIEIEIYELMDWARESRQERLNKVE